MSQISDNNKRIAKNTLFLYIRQIFVMVVALYTSRVVLATLGVTDYGIYNVVGGIVTLFTFINYAMSCSTTRFITFALGKKDEEGVNIAFSNALIVHSIISIIILILGETIGLYIFNTHINIPDDRIYAAGWVYQFSIFTCIINILSIPYNALITSHEKMNAFALISILETTLKWVIVWVLVVFSYDKLILYAILMFGVGVTIRIINQVYAIRTFKKVRFLRPQNFTMFKEMIVYAFWSLVGSSAMILSDQGQNILLNIYFGPSVNAARGVAMQVKSAVVGLCNNFNHAITPQINKSYAGGDIFYMHKLIFATSKYTYYLLFVMILPIILEAKVILGIWLVEIPENTVLFLQLILIISILTALGNPLSNAAGANGRIRNFQLIVGGINLLLLPFTWLMFKTQGKPMPEWAFYIQIVVCIIMQVARVLLVKPLIKLSIWEYMVHVVKPCVCVTVLASVLPVFLTFLMVDGLLSLVVITVVSIISVLMSIYTVGMEQVEKDFILAKIKKLQHDKNC
ncbi:oligosaccharide flippase family protein [Xylanibacter muris]|uniref:Oligosaccharide flippase family protein n=1 Tax=Xylanibacter muris TaxID=2736290 RepID=A0ABX2ALR7_9BACT|nr:oligosaccharide flippase family protein [Xylanibacter muris]